MNKKIVYLIIALIVFSVSLFVFLGAEKKEKEILLGGDKDEYGCIASAGYSWCPDKQKCLRKWEEKCELTEEEKQIPNDTEVSIPPNRLMINGDKNLCIENGGEWFENSKVCEINSLIGNMCVARGGEWNECNSACRHNPEAEMCTLQCVLTCSFR